MKKTRPNQSTTDPRASRVLTADFRRRNMMRATRSLPFVFSTLVGAFSTYAGWRSIVFYSGGSGFVVPVPTMVVVLFFTGITLLVVGALAYWHPRFSASVVIGCLFILVVSIAEQIFTHPHPSEVVLQRADRTGAARRY